MTRIKLFGRTIPVWVLVLLFVVGGAAAAVYYTYVTTTFTATVANLNISATLENTDFYVPDNGSTSVLYQITNESGETKTLSVISNVSDNTSSKLYFNCYKDWPNGSTEVWVDGVNYGFSIDNGVTENLRVIIGDTSADIDDTWATLQLYVVDNALA